VIVLDLKVGHNSKQSKTVKEYNSRTNTLTNELQTIQFQKDKQVNMLLSKIDLQEEAVRKTNRTMSEKMRKLQSALEDRMATMNSLTSRLSIAEADLALAEQKNSDLEHSLQRLQSEKENESRLFQSKAKREKEDFMSEKLRLERELNDSVQGQNQLGDRVKELERKCQELQSIAYDSKEKLAQGQAEYQIKMVVLDEEGRKLKQKHRDELKEYEASKHKEVERLKEDFENDQRSLKERVNKLESNKHLLEDEISRLKATVSSDKIMYEQQLHEIRTKVQLEEGLRRKELEDRVKTIQTSKEDLISENAGMNAKLVDFQQKISSKAMEIETLKRNNDALRSVSRLRRDLYLFASEISTLKNTVFFGYVGRGQKKKL
jgi:chromosome segregation ATPase